MKNRNLYVLGIVMIFISVGCNREEPFDNTEGNETETEARVISFTASIPSVRVALGQEEDNSISLSWEERDSIHLVFVQGENKIISGTRIKNISEDKKSAQFDIEIPGEIEDGELVLHGIYGNVTIESANPTWLVLPPDAEAAGSIEQVQEREDVILYFSSNLDMSSPSATASFNHLGSLFSVSLKNTSSRILDNIGELRLTGPAGGKWAYNSGGENGIYDLENEQFLNTGDAANYLAFQAVENSLAPGDSMAFWGWYPPPSRCDLARIKDGVI